MEIYHRQREFIKRDDHYAGSTEKSGMGNQGIGIVLSGSGYTATKRSVLPDGSARCGMFGMIRSFGKSELIASPVELSFDRGTLVLRGVRSGPGWEFDREWGVCERMRLKMAGRGRAYSRIWGKISR